MNEMNLCNKTISSRARTPTNLSQHWNNFPLSHRMGEGLSEVVHRVQGESISHG